MWHHVFGSPQKFLGAAANNSNHQRNIVRDTFIPSFPFLTHASSFLVLALDCACAINIGRACGAGHLPCCVLSDQKKLAQSLILQVCSSNQEKRAADLYPLHNDEIITLPRFNPQRQLTPYFIAGRVMRSPALCLLLDPHLRKKRKEILQQRQRGVRIVCGLKRVYT